MSNTQGYEANDGLPDAVRKVLPTEAQDVYRLAYNAALASGQSPGGANVAAWEAVRLGWTPAVDGVWTLKHEEV